MAGKQKAGDNSVQVQAGTIVNGIDEKRVREIVDERLPIALQNFSEEAYRIAAQRNSKFSEKLIDKIVAETLYWRSRIHLFCYCSQKRRSEPPQQNASQTMTYYRS